MLNAENIANALEKADWSNVSIGNKNLIRAAIIELRKSKSIEYSQSQEYDWRKDPTKNEGNGY